MINFASAEFVKTLSALQEIKTYAREKGKEIIQGNRPNLGKRKIALCSYLSIFIESSKPLPIPIARGIAEDLKRYMEKRELGMAAFADRMQMMEEVLHRELGSAQIYSVPSHFIKYLSAENEISDVVKTDLDVEEDFVEAGMCLAFGRSTACVFHLMRALERCVRRLCAAYGIKLEKPWGNLLASLQKVGLEPDPKKNADLQAIIVQLHFVKDVWRNPTMHPKNTYTAEEAERIFNASRAFLEVFAERFSINIE